MLRLRVLFLLLSLCVFVFLPLSVRSVSTEKKRRGAPVVIKGAKMVMGMNDEEEGRFEVPVGATKGIVANAAKGAAETTHPLAPKEDSNAERSAESSPPSLAAQAASATHVRTLTTTSATVSVDLSVQDASRGSLSRTSSSSEFAKESGEEKEDIGRIGTDDADKAPEDFDKEGKDADVPEKNRHSPRLRKEEDEEVATGGVTGGFLEEDDEDAAASGATGGFLEEDDEDAVASGATGAFEEEEDEEATTGGATGGIEEEEELEDATTGGATGSFEESYEKGSTGLAGEERKEMDDENTRYGDDEGLLDQEVEYIGMTGAEEDKKRLDEFDPESVFQKAIEDLNLRKRGVKIPGNRFLPLDAPCREEFVSAAEAREATDKVISMWKDSFDVPDAGPNMMDQTKKVVETHRVELRTAEKKLLSCLEGARCDDLEDESCSSLNEFLMGDVALYQRIRVDYETRQRAATARLGELKTYAQTTSALTGIVKTAMSLNEEGKAIAQHTLEWALSREKDVTEAKKEASAVLQCENRMQNAVEIADLRLESVRESVRAVTSQVLVLRVLVDESRARESAARSRAGPAASAVDESEGEVNRADVEIDGSFLERLKTTLSMFQDLVRPAESLFHDGSSAYKQIVEASDVADFEPLPDDATEDFDSMTGGATGGSDEVKEFFQPDASQLRIDSLRNAVKAYVDELVEMSSNDPEDGTFESVTGGASEVPSFQVRLPSYGGATGISEIEDAFEEFSLYDGPTGAATGGSGDDRLVEMFERKGKREGDETVAGGDAEAATGATDDGTLGSTGAFGRDTRKVNERVRPFQKVLENESAEDRVERIRSLHSDAEGEDDHVTNVVPELEETWRDHFEADVIPSVAASKSEAVEGDVAGAVFAANTAMGNDSDDGDADAIGDDAVSRHETAKIDLPSLVDDAYETDPEIVKRTILTRAKEFGSDDYEGEPVDTIIDENEYPDIEPPVVECEESRDPCDGIVKRGAALARAARAEAANNVGEKDDAATGVSVSSRLSDLISRRSKAAAERAANRSTAMPCNDWTVTITSCYDDGSDASLTRALELLETEEWGGNIAYPTSLEASPKQMKKGVAAAVTAMQRSLELIRVMSESVDRKSQSAKLEFQGIVGETVHDLRALEKVIEETFESGASRSRRAFERSDEAAAMVVRTATKLRKRLFALARQGHFREWLERKVHATDEWTSASASIRGDLNDAVAEIVSVLDEESKRLGSEQERLSARLKDFAPVAKEQRTKLDAAREIVADARKNAKVSDAALRAALVDFESAKSDLETWRAQNRENVEEARSAVRSKKEEYKKAIEEANARVTEAKRKLQDARNAANAAKEIVRLRKVQLAHRERVASLSGYIATEMYSKAEGELNRARDEVTNSRDALTSARERQTAAEARVRDARVAAADEARDAHAELKDATGRVKVQSKEMREKALLKKSEARDKGVKAKAAWSEAEDALGCVSDSGPSIEDSLRTLVPYDATDAASPEIRDEFEQAQAKYRELLSKVKETADKIRALEIEKSAVEKDLAKMAAAAKNAPLSATETTALLEEAEEPSVPEDYSEDAIKTVVGEDDAGVDSMLKKARSVIRNKARSGVREAEQSIEAIEARHELEKRRDQLQAEIDDNELDLLRTRKKLLESKLALADHVDGASDCLRALHEAVEKARKLDEDYERALKLESDSNVASANAANAGVKLLRELRSRHEAQSEKSRDRIDRADAELDTADEASASAEMNFADATALKDRLQTFVESAKGTRVSSGDVLRYAADGERLMDTTGLSNNKEVSEKFGIDAAAAKGPDRLKTMSETADEDEDSADESFASLRKDEAQLDAAEKTVEADEKILAGIVKESDKRVHARKDSLSVALKTLNEMANLEETEDRRALAREAVDRATTSNEARSEANDAWRSVAKDLFRAGLSEDAVGAEENSRSWFVEAVTDEKDLLDNDRAELRQISDDIDACVSSVSPASLHASLLHGAIERSGNDDAMNAEAAEIREELKFMQMRAASLKKRSKSLGALERDFALFVARILIKALSAGTSSEVIEERLAAVRDEIGRLAAVEKSSRDDAVSKENDLREALLASETSMAAIASASAERASTQSDETLHEATESRAQARMAAAKVGLMTEKLKQVHMQLASAIDHHMDARSRASEFDDESLDAFGPTGGEGGDAFLGATGATGAFVDRQAGARADAQAELRESELSLERARKESIAAGAEAATAKREAVDLVERALKAEDEHRAALKLAADAKTKAADASTKRDAFESEATQFVEDMIEGDAGDSETSSEMTEQAKLLRALPDAEHVMRSLASARASREKELTLHEQLRSVTELAQLLVKMKSGIQNRELFKDAASELLSASATLLARQDSVKKVVDSSADLVSQVDDAGLDASEYGRYLHVYDKLLDARLSLQKSTKDLEAKRATLTTAVEHRAASDAEDAKAAAEAAKTYELEETDRAKNDEARELLKNADASLHLVESSLTEETEKKKSVETQIARLRGQMKKLEASSEKHNAKIHAREDADMKRIEASKAESMRDLQSQIKSQLALLHEAKTKVDELATKFANEESSLQHLRDEAKEACEKSAKLSKDHNDLTKVQAYMTDWNRRHGELAKKCADASERYSKKLDLLKNVESTVNGRVEEETSKLRELESRKEGIKKASVEEEQTVHETEARTEKLNEKRLAKAEDPIRETLESLEKSLKETSSRLKHLKHTGKKLVAVRDKYRSRIESITEAYHEARESWQRAQDANREAVDAAKVASAAAVDAYEAQLHAERDVKAHQKHLEAMQKYAKTVLGVEDLKESEDELESLRDEMAEKFRRSLRSANEAATAAKDGTDRASRLLDAARKKEEVARQQVVDAHREVANVQYEAKRDIETLQEGLITLRKPTEIPSVAISEDARGEYQRALDSQKRSETSAKTFGGAIDVNGEQVLNGRLNAALESVLTRSRRVLELMDGTVQDAEDARKDASSSETTGNNFRMAEVRSKARLSAGVAAAQRAAMTSKLATLRKRVASASAKVVGDEEAVQFIRSREDEGTVHRVSRHAKRDISDLKRAQKDLDSLTGLSFVAVEGTFDMSEAAAACEMRDATLCSHADMTQIFLQGHHSCSCGWTSTTLDSGSSFVVEYVSQPHMSCDHDGGEWGLVLCGEKNAVSSTSGGYAANCCSRSGSSV
eukprot:g2779.t1